MSLAVLLLAGVLLSPPTASRVQEGLKSVYADPEIQQVVPGGSHAGAKEEGGAHGRDEGRPMPPGGDTEGWKRRWRPGAPPAGGASQPHVPAFPAWFGRLLLFALVGGAVLVLVLFLASLARGRTPDVAAPAAHEESSGAVAALDRPLEDARALAAQGRFGEAIHVLLLDTLDVLALREHLPAALTSREILDGLELGAEPRASLEALVAAVEVSRFGGQEADREDFDACLVHFDTLRETLGRPGA